MESSRIGVILSLMLLITDAQTCGKPRVSPEGPSSRITGGSSAAPGSWPWMARLGHRSANVNYFYYRCGATVIGDRWLLTAAYCLLEGVHVGDSGYKLDTDPENYAVQITQFLTGDTTSHYKIKRIIVHEDFEAFDHGRTIALIELEETIQFSDFIQPACLPEGGIEPSVGQACLAAGWGKLSIDSNHAGVLQQAKLNVLPRVTCAAHEAVIGPIRPNMLCGSMKTCDGDAGGPLLCKSSCGAYVLEGIISWDTLCVNGKTPGLYTRTSYYMEWIHQNTGIRSNGV